MEARSRDRTIRNKTPYGTHTDIRTRDIMKSRWMTPPETDARIPSDAPLELAVATIALEGSPAIRVFEGGRPVGVITDMDLLRALRPTRRSGSAAV